MRREDMLIEADELLRIVDREDLRLYDATIQFFGSASGLTAREEYVQEHIPGAAFFDHEQFSDPDADYDYMVLPEARLAGQIGQIGISARSPVVFYTSSFLPLATRAWWLLRYAGHDHVRVLNGGLAAWKAAGGKVEAGERRYPPAVFRCRLRPGMFAAKEEVLAALEASDVRIVNTLPKESFEEARIVGSTCLPAFHLMQAMTTLLPDDQIAQRLQEEAQARRVITYCGGGIAATLNAMAHLLAGNENVAVYDGSMAEWVGEDLPTAGLGTGQYVMWQAKRAERKRAA
jgi:thiosulfate/3-mercaptopyruvate sulfurtransferase